MKTPILAPSLLSANFCNLEKAIKKIENNQYGKCEMCNKNIDIRRLRAKPYARFCIACRELYEKQNSKK
mgnify:CR=1 FL=1